MSDDTQFWTALIPWTVVKAAHSLGLVSLGAHDHIGAPVPHMLIGQAFAVASLVAVHYGTKNAEEIVAFTRDVFNETGKLSIVAQQNFDSRFNQFEQSAKQGMSNAGSAIDTKLNSLSSMMSSWTKKMDEYDPGKVIPSADHVWRKILGERVWNALGSIGVENDKDISS
jgi:hypothetical protein